MDWTAGYFGERTSVVRPIKCVNKYVNEIK